MPEILAVLDAAIAEVGQRVRASSRTSRRADGPLAEAGSGELLKQNALPALPVVPVENDAGRDGTDETAEQLIVAASNLGGNARVETILENSGSTGTTGSSEDSCGLESSRDVVVHGNYGNTEASRAVECARPDETGSAARPFSGAPTEWLDGAARLRTIPVPPRIAEAQWNGIVGTADELLRRWGAQLAALGWTAADVFGVDPNAPWERIDCMGLLPLLRDCEVTAVTAETAILKTQSGATQRFYRRHPALGRPLWELIR